MALRSGNRSRLDAFAAVRAVGVTLPYVEEATRYDGSPVLKLGGAFMAGLAVHESVEPDTLVVRVALDQREYLLEEAPDTYYVTDYYRPHPIVLVRLSRIDAAALHDLLRMSWQVTLPKARLRGRTPR